MIDLSQQRFGRLIVIKQHGRNNDKRILWLCICDCGNHIVVNGKLLKNGDTKSCGCLRKQIMTKHGYSKTKIYRIWQQMIQRCTNSSNKAYKDYGARNISVCSRWLVFDNFLKDMGEQPVNQSLDRIDNNRGYTKCNCRWTTPKHQAQNRRDTYLVTHNSRTQCLTAWAEETGINRNTLQYRLDNGWSVKKAIEQRTRKYKKNT